MFKFKKKKSEDFKDLPQVRDLMKDLLGETMNVYMGTTIEYLMNFGGKTAEDAERAKELMLETLQKYVRAEILLDRQKNGHGPSLAELVFLRPECSYERPAQAAEVAVPEHVEDALQTPF